jgi:hypothetical protein
MDETVEPVSSFFYLRYKRNPHDLITEHGSFGFHGFLRIL